MIACPYCRSGESQVRAGRSGGQQRYKCNSCQRRYLIEAGRRGLPDAVRQQALALHTQGVPVGAISRAVGVSGQSVRNWLRARGGVPAQKSPHPSPAVPAEAGTPGHVTPPKRRPTINDVARQAGVSRSTVSNLLNSKGRMSEATRTRVQAAMDALHFTPSALVRAIHRRRTRILGVLVFGLTTIGRNAIVGTTSSLIAGIAAAADAAGYNILLYTGWERGAGRHAALEFLDGQIDGLLWVAPALHEPALERLAQAGLPVVALLSRHVPDGIGYVNADNVAGIRDTVTALGALGHRRIAYIGADRDSNFLDRRDGYRAGLAALGLPHDLQLEAPGSFQPDTFGAAVRTLTVLSVPPTAIVAPSDSWAQGIGAAVLKAGLRIPDDISITGFDDSAEAQHMLGGLTTVRQPFREMGQLAGERLLALIDGTPVADCRVTLPTKLILRASTSPPRHRD